MEERNHLFHPLAAWHPRLRQEQARVSARPPSPLQRQANTVSSLVIEDAFAAFGRDESLPPAYFYCSRNPAEPGRSDPEKILASIARQLSRPVPNGPLLQEVIAAYDVHEGEGFSAESLRSREIRELIVQLTSHYPTATIILDALDECDLKARRELLADIEFILQRSSCPLKIFVSSRNDQDIVYKLQGYPNLEMSSSRNFGDIKKFVESETGRLIACGAMLRFSPIKQELHQTIIEDVVSGAKGM